MKSEATKELERKLIASAEKDRKKAEKLAFEKCGYKIGDIVEFIDRERKGDYDYIYHWNNKPIKSMFIQGEYVFLRFDYAETMKSTDVKLFDKNDYTLRHSLWDRELDLNDEFQLIVDKPKSTKGEIYKVFRIEKEVDCNIQYMYYNDYGKMAIVTDGQFHVTTRIY